MTPSENVDRIIGRPSSVDYILPALFAAAAATGLYNGLTYGDIPDTASGAFSGWAAYKAFRESFG